MKKHGILVCIVLIFALVLQTSCSGAPAGDGSASSAESASAPETGNESSESAASEEELPAVTLTADEIKDRIAGSWAAQMIGVAWGAPTEFQYQGIVIPEDKVPEWSPQMINGAFGQDDLYVEIPFLDVMSKNGPDCAIPALADAFRDTAFPLDHANAQARANLRAGIPAPQSGSYLYNYHCDDIDWQIEADFLGNLYPGLVDKAAERAFDIGHIINYGDGVYGGVYVAAMHAAAFTAGSVYEIAEAGRCAIPVGSSFRAVIDEVDECRKSGMTWQECWQKIQDDWAHTARCLRYAGTSANIDAKLNAAYIHIGLLWGEGDLAETVKISMRCGQDSDCNPSSAAGVLGAFYGLSGLPEEYVSALDRKGIKFSNTDYSFDKCVETSYALAVRSLESGSADGTVYRLPVYVPDPEKAPVPLEQWPSDIPCAYLTVTALENGRVRIETAFMLPEGYNGDAVHILDMGDGCVLPFSAGAYEYTEDGEYTVRYTVKTEQAEASAVARVTVSGAEKRPEGRTLEQDSVLIISVTEPRGTGCKDTEVIRDGYVPRVGDNYISVSYDTFAYSAIDHEEFVGYVFRSEKTVAAVTFTEGANFSDGGFFKDGGIRLEILKDGVWHIASAALDRPYPVGNSCNAFGPDYESYRFELDAPAACSGVRVIGPAGGTMHFISVSELSVETVGATGD